MTQPVTNDALASSRIICSRYLEQENQTNIAVDVTPYQLHRLIKIVNYVIIGYYTKMCRSGKG